MDPNEANIPVEDAMRIGLKLQHSGRIDEAASVYRQILLAYPDQPDALHFLGMVCYQKGQIDESAALIRKAVEVSPTYTDAYNNLGNVLDQSGQHEAAITAYKRVIAIDPEHWDALNNLAILLSRRGECEEAEATFRTVIRLKPEFADAHYNLGNTLVMLARQSEAIAAFRQTLAINPRHIEAYKGLGMTLYESGESDAAAEVFSRWLDISPDHPMALHMLAVCAGRQAPWRASDGYITRSFDRLAESFDEHLHALDYRAPSLVIEAIRRELGVAWSDLSILDAGCGTGLCGPLLRPFAQHLIGVDLSSGMLSRAREKAVYDDLVQSELTELLLANPASYDLIACVDTLVYFGDLSRVFRAAAQALKPGGLLAFSIEKAGRLAIGAGFEINMRGRYAHTADYLRITLKVSNLSVRSFRLSILRMEAGQSVEGMVVVAEMTAAHGS